MKWRAYNNGFAIVPILLVTVVLAVIVAVGIFVARRASAPTDAATQSVATPTPTIIAQVSPTPTIQEQILPEGYVRYTNTEVGFSFAYPASWGEIIFSPEENGRTSGYFSKEATRLWLVRLHKRDLPFMPTDSPTLNLSDYNSVGTKGLASSDEVGRRYIVKAMEGMGYTITGFGKIEDNEDYDMFILDYLQGTLDTPYTASDPSAQQIIQIMQTFEGTN